MESSLILTPKIRITYNTFRVMAKYLVASSNTMIQLTRVILRTKGLSLNIRMAVELYSGRVGQAPLE